MPENCEAGHIFTPYAGVVREVFGISEHECTVCHGYHPDNQPGDFIEDEVSVTERSDQ